MMANAPTPEFQKLSSNLIESLRLEYENTIQQHPDTDAVVGWVHGVLTTIACLAGCTPASVNERPKWTLIAQNMGGTRRNLHQILKGKAAVYRTVFSVHIQVIIKL
jgi:hypothetical protein